MNSYLKYNLKKKKKLLISLLKNLFQIQTHTKNKLIEIAPPKDDKLYNFDYFFDKTIKDKMNNNPSSSEDDESDED